MNDSDARSDQPAPRIHKRKKQECLYVDYHVARPDGVMVNEILYIGKVNVPSCVANTLSEQDQHWRNAELTLMSNKGKSSVIAQYRE